MRWTRAGHDDGRARLPYAAAGRSPGTRRRTLGLLGIAGLSAAATVGFGASALASPSPSASDSPAAPAPSTLGVSLTPSDTSVKSGGTVTYSAILTVSDGPVTDADVTLTGDRHGGKLTWSGCDQVLTDAASGALTCHLKKIANGTTTKVATLTAPKVKTNTAITLTVTADGTGADGKGLTEQKAVGHAVTVKKVPTSTATPTPTKTVKPTPTKSRSKKPSARPTSSHSKKPSSHPRSTPRDNGHVPVPTNLPTGGVPTSGLPSVPNGSQSPFPFDPPSSTPVPNLPTPGVSPDGPVRTPNVADPQKKATGLVRSDAVSVPAAAAAAFIGLGAGTLITRAVRRRGLWHPIGRHRD